MKVTVKSTPQKKAKIRFEDVKPGEVFEYEDGVVALKLKSNEAVLLAFNDGAFWLGTALARKSESVKKILGILTEIIVEEQNG